MITDFFKRKTILSVMNKVFIVVSFLLIVGCTTKPTVVEKVEPAEEKSILPEEIEEIEEVEVVILEPETIAEQNDIPYDIAFATALQNALNNGTMEDALSLFEDIPEEHANDENLNYLHASILVSAGNLSEAEVLIDELQTKDSENTDLMFLQALVLKEQGNTRESKKIIEDILEKDPTNIDANVEMANTYMYVKNFRLANKHFVAGLESDPNDAASLFGHALTSWYLENDTIAQNALNRLIEVEPENSLAWAYLGKLSADKGLYEEAVEYLKTAIEFEEDYSSHWLDLGSFYRSMNNKEEAENAWSKAIELDPTYFLGYAYRGGLRDEMGKYDGALSDYNNVVKYNPEYYFAYESIGMLYWKDEKWTESRNAFLRAFGANTKNVSYALLISATYLKEGKKIENQEFLTEVMRGVNRDSLDYMMLRLYYDGLGDAAVLNKVVNEDSNTTRGRMLFYMAVFYEIIGMQDLANKYYIEVADMQAPIFFEYRFCEWAVEKMKKNNISY